MGMDAYQGKGLYKHSFGTKYEAASLFRDAAEHGNPEAQRWLGRMYAEGDGVEKNYPESVKWYRMAAELGNLEAITELQNLGEDSRDDAFS